MLCAVCREREAVYYSIRVPRDTPPEQCARCLRCWEREEAAGARVDEQRVREMDVDWSQIRPIIERAEARGRSDELLMLSEKLQHAVDRYGRTLPPDVAAFLERHRRSRPAV